MTETVVVGAGIGGLAAAILLGRSGRSVTVYERSAHSGSGSALLLQPNGLAVLDAIGVVEPLRDAGSEVRTLRLFDHRLRVISEVSVPGGPSHDYALVVPRPVLRAALEQVALDEGVELLADRPVVGVTVDADHGRPVVTVDGADGSRSVSCALVVGADGAGSVVRSSTFPPGSTSTRTDRRYLRAVVDWTVAPALVGEHWTRRGIAGLLPCGAGRTYWFATATPSMIKAHEDGDLQKLKRVVAVAHPQLLHVANALDDVGQVSVATTHSVQVDQLYHRAVVLVGDAAHAMAPNLGQGANSALVDAGVLAWELGQRDALADALAAYDARRTPAVGRVRSDADRLARLAHVTGGRRFRNVAFRLLPDRFAQTAALRAQQVDLPSFRAELRSLNAS